METASNEDGVSLLIVFLLVQMHASVNFHHKICRMAEEVYNEAVNDLLLTKVQALKTAATQMHPELSLRRRRITSKFSRQLTLY
ncbi:hypothetical protein CCAX7_21070 [Capsulimonas corticalis]|uniref:Uncharacterized protein n=1 Tax=Capsulimonas corticalis TaxID=2219043 RepID=A0A402D1S8_9BACT|nr:hypothetical protein [Capsulimonas corticalis]BDI30056.1 hypothetical protein CCAX7_21070 [Capsulimonas corticalis]